MLLDALEYSEDEVEDKDYLSTFVPAEDRERVSDIFRRIVRDSSATLNETGL